MSHIVGGQAAASLAGKYGTLTEIVKADTAELTVLPGVGPYRALQIRAALELAGRLSREVLGDSPLLDTPESVAAIMREEARTCRTEVFHIHLLNTRKRLIRKVQIATGTLDTLLVHAREVFCHAIVANATAVVLCHNHPSGQSDPSSQDIAVTRDLIRAGQLLKIEVLDHVIMGASTTERPKDYSSLRELGYFYAGESEKPCMRQKPKSLDELQSIPSVNAFVIASPLKPRLALFVNHLTKIKIMHKDQFIEMDATVLETKPRGKGLEYWVRCENGRERSYYIRDAGLTARAGHELTELQFQGRPVAVRNDQTRRKLQILSGQDLLGSGPPVVTRGLGFWAVYFLFAIPVTLGFLPGTIPMARNTGKTIC